MNLKRIGSLLTLSLLLSTGLAPRAGEVPLDGTPLWPLAWFIGQWEIDTTWSDGTPLRSRNVFTVGLGGRFLEAQTFAADGDGDMYERYRTIYAYDNETGQIVSYGFTYDGSVTIVDDMKLDEDGPALTSEWSGDGAAIRQTVKFLSPDEYNWKVWTRTDGDWGLIMDANWHRVDD